MFPTIVGFGYSVTGCASQVIDQLDAQKMLELINISFGNKSNSILISYLGQYWCLRLKCRAITIDDLQSRKTTANLFTKL